MTRRELALAMGALAASSLPGCGLLRRREEVPDMTISGVEDARAYMLDALCERYGEEFRAIDEVDPAINVVDASQHRNYELALVPVQDEDKPFGCSVSTNLSDDKLDSPAYDDYTQYLFKERMEGPYREAVAGVGELAGYSVTLREPYMGDRLWRADELEEYLNNGYTHPRVRVLLMLLRNGDFDSWAATIHDALAAVWGLDRRMDVYAGVEGTDPFSSSSPLYTLDISQTSPKTRDAEPPDAATVRRLMWVLGDDDTSPWDGYEPWDGTGDPGDPGYARRRPITWNPGHPVMG